MLINIIRAVVLLGGPAVGYFQISNDWKGILIGLVAAGVVIGVELVIDHIPLDSIISAVIGAILGLISAQLMNWVVFQMNNPKLYELAERYSLLTNLMFACLGAVIFIRKRSELDLIDRDLIVKGGKRKNATTHIVDTSALIDGRVADVCESRFVAGTLVVPRFVLAELQHVADSADAVRRAKGRRGMDILSRLQENAELPVRIFDKDFPEIREVDSKIVSLAKELGAKVITTDFNLNKIASLQGVTVLNVNDLANALKPVVLPGEAMSAFVVKEGKEKDQGVAYLDDGTMVVVEEGRRSVGQKVTVIVSSILQTSAGRMIFAKAVRERHHDQGHRRQEPAAAGGAPSEPHGDAPEAGGAPPAEA
jgi:uncharacterized protein YacL